jgi:DNA-binding response OmpR family regulator
VSDAATGPSAPRALIVEDDDGLREAIGLVVAADGMTSVSVGSGSEAIAAFADGSFDLVLLDVMLPEGDGFEVCRRIRRDSQVPIVMVTALSDRGAIVGGLELGADDYVTKPFETEVLLARIHAVLRRAVPVGKRDQWQAGPITVDSVGHRAVCDGRELALTPTEFRLLAELSARAGEALTRGSLLRLVWGYEYLGDSRIVDMAIKRLRDKLAASCGMDDAIVTVRGVGYRFDVP